MTAAAQQNDVSCPKCGGAVWDNRTTKRNPKAPDYKCRDRGCDGAIWPPKAVQRPAARPAPQSAPIDIGVTGIAELDEDLHTAAPQPTANEATKRLNRILKIQDVCFAHALLLAEKAHQQHDIAITLEGVSALTAQALIQFCGSGRVP